MFESDSWLDWDPNPERASAAADPALEPYASMSRQELLRLMLAAKGGREWEFLQEYYLDRCSPEELAVSTPEFLKAQYEAFGAEMLCYLEGAVDLALRRRKRPGASRGPGGGAVPRAPNAPAESPGPAHRTGPAFARPVTTPSRPWRGAPRA